MDQDTDDDEDIKSSLNLILDKKSSHLTPKTFVKLQINVRDSKGEEVVLSSSDGSYISGCWSCEFSQKHLPQNSFTFVITVGFIFLN